jgi:putative peptidoglycan lipid II flippase
MVEKIFNFINKEWGGLHEAAFLLGSAAVASQVLALVRDRLFAHAFGATATLDIYYASFRIPDFLFVSIASFVSVTVLIPFLIEKLGRGGEAGRIFIDNVFTVFFFTIVLVSIGVFLLVPKLTQVLFPGIIGGSRTELILLTRVMLLSPILLGFSNLLGSITQTAKKFFVYALSPILYNLGIISGILFFYPFWGIAGLAYGVIFGAALHLLVQVPSVIQFGLLPRFSWKFKFTDIKDVVYLSLPRTIGLSINQVALLALVSLASRMSEGSIAIFNFSFNLQSVPLAIVGVSYSVAAFPTLAHLFSKNERRKFIDNIVSAARHIVFWSVPILVLFIVLRAQIVRTILGSGAFNWSDTLLTAASLALFAVSLVAQSLILLFVRGYYAAGNTKTPLLVNMVSSVLTIILAYVLVDMFNSIPFFRYFMESLLRVNDGRESIVIMLPFAYSVGMILNALALFALFKNDFKGMPSFLRRTFMHSFLGAVTMGFVAYIFLGIFGRILNLNTFLGIFFQGFLSGVLGIFAGVMLLRLMHNRELEEVAKALHSKFWKTPAIAPDKEEL